MTAISTPRWLVGLLLAVVVAVYWPALPAAFQFDDWNVIAGDARVQSLADWWRSMPGIRAILKLSYALNFEIDRWVAVGTVGFRAVNIALHAANAVFLVAILRRVLTVTIPAPSSMAVGLLALMALIFALHPVQTESVTYISGRSNSLMATLALGSIYCWMRSDEAARPWIWQILSTVLFLLACGAKESAVMTPLAMWLIYRVGGAKRKPWLQTLALGLAVATLLALPGYRTLLAHSLGLRSAADNLLLVQPQAILYLLGQLFRVDNLNVDPLLATPNGWDAAALWRLLAMAAFLALGIFNLRRKPALAFGILWFFLWLAPTNSLLARNDMVNDRQLYLAIVGPAWLLALGLFQMRTRLAGRAWLVATTLVLAVALGYSTVKRNRVYNSEIAFWEDATRKSPDNPRAHNNLGLAYARVCRNEAAAEEFRRALQADPDYFLAANNREMLILGELAPPGKPCEQAAGP